MCERSRDCSYDHEQSTPDGADCDETVFEIGMIAVENLQIVDIGFEEPACLFEGHTVLLLSDEVLLVVPLEVHRERISQRTTKSMTYIVSWSWTRQGQQIDSVVREPRLWGHVTRTWLIAREHRWGPPIGTS